MAAAEGVGAGQSDNLLVIEAHAVEDVAEVVVGLGGVGEAAVGGAAGDVLVLATRAVGDRGTEHLLDGADATEDPEIRESDPGELLCCPVLAISSSHLDPIRWHVSTYP